MNQITFIDFLKSLITETISAVSETQFQQEAKIIELKEDLIASNEALKNKYNLLEEAKEELGDKAKPKDIEEYINFRIYSIKEAVSTYFENGYIKPIIDKCKLSANFIYNYNSGVEDLDTNKTNIGVRQKEKKQILSKLNKEQLKAVYQNKKLPKKVFQFNDEKISAISKNMTIQTIDLSKDKEVINTNQNLTSSVELEFRTVIVK